MNSLIDETQDLAKNQIVHDKGTKSAYLRRPKVLYVSDSVGCNVNMRLVEELSNTRVRTMQCSGSGKELSHVV